MSGVEVQVTYPNTPLSLAEMLSMSDHTLHYFEAFLPAMLGVAAVIATAWWTRKIDRESADIAKSAAEGLAIREREERRLARADELESTRRQLRHELGSNRRLLRDWIGLEFRSPITNEEALDLFTYDHLPDIVKNPLPPFSFDLWTSQLLNMTGALAEQEQIAAWTYNNSLRRIQAMADQAKGKIAELDVPPYRGVVGYGRQSGNFMTLTNLVSAVLNADIVEQLDQPGPFMSDAALLGEQPFLR